VCSSDLCCWENDDGPWVAYEDVKADLAAAKAEVERWKETFERSCDDVKALDDQLAEKTAECDRLAEDIDTQLPHYTLDDGTGEEANDRETIEYVGRELLRLRSDNAAAIDNCRLARAANAVLRSQLRTSEEESEGRRGRIEQLLCTLDAREEELRTLAEWCIHMDMGKGDKIELASEILDRPLRAYAKDWRKVAVELACWIDKYYEREKCDVGELVSEVLAHQGSRPAGEG
jgi:hypothetical protein